MAQEFLQAGMNTAPNLADKEQFQSLVPGMSSYESQESQDVDTDVGNVPGSKSLSTTAVHFDIFRKHLMLSLNRRNPSIVQVRLPASRRDFSFPFRRFPDFRSEARARVKKKEREKY